MTAEISRALSMKGSDIRLLDQKTKVLTLMSSFGLSDDFLNNPQMSRSDMTLSALNGKTVVIKDINRDDTFHLQDILKQEGIVALIMTPITVRNVVIGTMSLYCDTPRYFLADMTDMIQALAHQGGLAIQNASLYLKLQEDKKDLEADIWSHRSWF